MRLDLGRFGIATASIRVDSAEGFVHYAVSGPRIAGVFTVMFPESIWEPSTVMIVCGENPYDPPVSESLPVINRSTIQGVLVRSHLDWGSELLDWVYGVRSDGSAVPPQAAAKLGKLVKAIYHRFALRPDLKQLRNAAAAAQAQRSAREYLDQAPALLAKIDERITTLIAHRDKFAAQVAEHQAVIEDIGAIGSASPPRSDIELELSENGRATATDHVDLRNLRVSYEILGPRISGTISVERHRHGLWDRSGVVVECGNGSTRQGLQVNSSTVAGRLHLPLDEPGQLPEVVHRGLRRLDYDGAKVSPGTKARVVDAVSAVLNHYRTRGDLEQIKRSAIKMDAIESRDRNTKQVRRCDDNLAIQRGERDYVAVTADRFAAMLTTMSREAMVNRTGQSGLAYDAADSMDLPPGLLDSLTVVVAAHPSQERAGLPTSGATADTESPGRASESSPGVSDGAGLG